MKSCWWGGRLQSESWEIRAGGGGTGPSGLKGGAPPPPCLLFPRSEYKIHFSPRDLRAFSVEPLLVYPTHYTGDDGYVSDTETSVVWNNEQVKTDWDRAKSQKMREQQALSREAKNSDVLQSPLDSAARDEL